MDVRLRRSVLAVVFSVVPALAAADPITISLLREVAVAVDAVVGGGDFEQHAFDNGRDELTASLTFSRGVAAGTGNVTFESRLSPDARHVSGLARGSWIGESDGGFGNGASVEIDTNLIWQFRIDQPFLFNFDGSFSAPIPEDVIDGGTWSTTLGSTSRIIFEHSQFQQASDAFSLNGRLDPGEYTFQVLTFVSRGVNKGTATGSLDMDFGFELTPATPEPGSIVLLGTGLFGLAGAARKRWLSA